MSAQAELCELAFPPVPKYSNRSDGHGPESSNGSQPPKAMAFSATGNGASEEQACAKLHPTTHYFFGKLAVGRAAENDQTGA